MNKIKNTIKNNYFTFIVILVYAILIIFLPKIAVTGVKNSAYYIKEMLTIMPVIFILTALLDTWIPKEMIIKYLGNSSKATGILLSFVLGSVSAGPIYAAFPFCIMLKKKGASVRNITIILSSWAVIKIPMLLNEAKFLGSKFMLTRWVLTIIAILIFSWITSKIVKSNEIIITEPITPKGLSIDSNACMGCSICTKKCPDAFYMEGGKSHPKENVSADTKGLNDAISSCPVKAINFK